MRNSNMETCKVSCVLGHDLHEFRLRNPYASSANTSKQCNSKIGITHILFYALLVWSARWKSPGRHRRRRGSKLFDRKAGCHPTWIQVGAVEIARGAPRRGADSNPDRHRHRREGRLFNWADDWLPELEANGCLQVTAFVWIASFSGFVFTCTYKPKDHYCDVDILYVRAAHPTWLQADDH